MTEGITGHFNYIQLYPIKNYPLLLHFKNFAILKITILKITS